jgi:hypothetical protein
MKRKQSKPRKRRSLPRDAARPLVEIASALDDHQQRLVKVEQAIMLLAANAGLPF